MESLFSYFVMVVGCFVCLTIALFVYRALGFKECLGLQLYTWSDMHIAIHLIGILSIFPPLLPIAMCAVIYMSFLRRIFKWLSQRELLAETARDIEQRQRLSQEALKFRSLVKELGQLADNVKKEKGDVK